MTAFLVHDKLRIVDISGMAVSSQPGAMLVTYSLGSCVGITMYAADLRLGGMIHCMLPLSTQEPAKARARPAMFTDTGVQTLLRALYKRGARRRNLIVKLAGGGAPLDDKGFFKVGERNAVIARRILAANRIPIAAEDLGGKHPRTLYLEVDSGRTLVRCRGELREL